MLHAIIPKGTPTENITFLGGINKLAYQSGGMGSPDRIIRCVYNIPVPLNDLNEQSASRYTDGYVFIAGVRARPMRYSAPSVESV